MTKTTKIVFDKECSWKPSKKITRADMLSLDSALSEIERKNERLKHLEARYNKNYNRLIYLKHNYQSFKRDLKNNESYTSSERVECIKEYRKNIADLKDICDKTKIEIQQCNKELKILQKNYDDMLPIFMQGFKDNGYTLN